MQKKIPVKTSEEIEIMREGGKILGSIIGRLQKEVRPGIKTEELDRLAESLIFSSGGSCSFKGYESYPACLCASVNEEIVHALPSGRILKDGDIISLDLGILYKGFHTDMATTVAVGKIKSEAEKLIEITRNSLEMGIEQVKSGKHFGDIGKMIQKYAESQGFNVIRELCGHGIGRELHEEPQILNYDDGEIGSEFVEGMVFCIEPMITVGDWRLKIGADKFAYETKDGSLSCHFEHTVAVTKTGCQILTKL